MTQNPRQLAFLALRSIYRGAFADVAVDKVLHQTDLSAPDRRLLTEIVYGCVRRQRTLDTLIDQLATKKTQQPPDLRIILQVGFISTAIFKPDPAVGSSQHNRRVSQAKWISRFSRICEWVIAELFASC